MFIPGDIYTSSGSNTLYGCWTDKVTKYDASSFYNWEEDNLPLHDLDERTHLLWERLGNPTSAVTGFKLLVSGDASEACGRNIFTSLSSMLESLPEVINAPYLIEVASFGNLGSLSLENKVFGPNGSIEIINRCFASTQGVTSSVAIYTGDGYTGDTYGLFSSLSMEATLAAGHDLGGVFNQVPSIVHEFTQVSSVGFSSLVCSSTTTMDARLQNNATVFARRTDPINNLRMTAALAATNTTNLWSHPTAGKVSFLPYEYTMGASEKRTTYDTSCINELTDAEIAWNNIANTAAPQVAAVVYGNRLTNLKIVNCNGPIFIRNFTVDGGGSGGREFGIEVRNSSKVVLERCSAARATRAGLLADNSDVILTRGFVAYRNYPFDSAGNRVGVNYLSKVDGGFNQSTSAIWIGAGIHAKNSTINFSSTAERDWGQYTTKYNSISSSVTQFLHSPELPAAGDLYCFDRNNIGILAEDSIIVGGTREVSGYGNPAIVYYNAGSIVSELNDVAGLQLDNSKLSLDGRLVVKGNFYGIKAANSVIETDSLICKYNQKTALELFNSLAKYNKNKMLSNGGTITPESAPYNIHQNTFFYNGKHIHLESSEYSPTYCSGIPLYYGKFIASGAFGLENNRQNPSIIVDSGSKLEVVNFGLGTAGWVVDQSPGCAIKVDNGSEFIMNGTSGFASRIIGPATYSEQEFKAGIHANNGSKVRISGPNIHVQYAVNILADNNSEVDICPHKDSYGNIDINGYGLANEKNHTMVELHSTRACIVANKGSTVNLNDLGDYRTNWANGSYGSGILLSSLDYLTHTTMDTKLYTSAGFLQFYPNAVDESNYPPAIESVGLSMYGSDTFTENAYGYYYKLVNGVPDIGTQSDFSAVTTGGVCLRAINNSIVNVKNVHFPAGWWNPSGTIYEVSSGSNPLCDRLFIWNIADGSKLKAEYVSTSAVHPGDAPYHGPAGTWGAASAAPTSTPDTSSVSILDFYGSANNHLYAKSSFENRGPFRLYFSIDPGANWLLTSALNLDGYIPQVFAQGYQFSGNSTFDPSSNVSSYYTGFLKNNNGVAQPSGFFYGSSIVADSNEIRAVLDDSAANLFANAKHCSVGKSGMAKLVTLYFPYGNTYGGETADSGSKSRGKGFRSTNIFDLEGKN